MVPIVIDLQLGQPFQTSPPEKNPVFAPVSDFQVEFDDWKS